MVEFLGDRGVAPDHRLLRLIYLTLTSRLVERPICLAIKGPSASGKTFAVDNVLRLFPPAGFIKRTAMSERALIYTDESFVHRILILVEAAAVANSQWFNYMLRSLLSERRINFEVSVQQKDGSWKTRHVEKEGPTGLIVTTTRNSLDAELETRMFSAPTLDTRVQTRAILDAFARGRLESAALINAESAGWQPWIDLQQWLEAGPTRVRIPYVRVLAAATRDSAVRLRRDFPQLVSFVEAHALLHRAQRTTRDGEVVARIRDYAAVHALVADLINEQAGAGVAPSVRETVDAVTALLKKTGRGRFSGQASGVAEFTQRPVGVAELAQHLQIDRTTAWRRVDRAIRLRFLTNVETHRGRPAQLVLGEPMPGSGDVLPTPQRLRRLWRRRRSRNRE